MVTHAEGVALANRGFMPEWSKRMRAIVATGAVAASSLTMVAITAESALAAPNQCTNLDGYFWADQQDMADASAARCRSTWVVDPGQGRLADRDLLLRNQALYDGLGFSRQFLWYAAQTTVDIAGKSPQQWSSCVTNSSRNGAACRPENVERTADHTIAFDFGQRPVGLDALAFQGNFIALVCGNTSLPLPAAGQYVPAPVPVIRGTKFNDVNRDRRREAGEGPVPGITFRLVRVASAYDQPAGLVTETASAPDGSFGFRLDGIGPGTYRVEEAAAPGWVSTTDDSQTIVVNPGIGDQTFDMSFGNREQHPPVADAGPAQTVDQTSPSGASITLDGSGSHDPDGDPLAYKWSTPFGTADGVRPTVTLPAGTWTVSLTVDDGIARDTATTSVTVYPPITAHPVGVTALEGLPFITTVATFTDPDPTGSADQYTASVDWSDGTPATTAAITKDPGGTFTVVGGHTYAEEGPAHPTATVSDKVNPFNTAIAHDDAAIGDAPLTAAGVPGNSTNPVDRVLATFTDANPGAPLSDFTATVDWGDGTPVTPGVVSGPTGGPFAVSGTHAYADLGPKTIKVHIVDEGGQTADATTNVLVYAPSGFVIGDKSAAVGTAVTYWGAQWWKRNGLTAGPAPAAFKGYENNPGASTAMDRWTTDPGNSSKPPATVPTYMSVIVSSQITQAGSTISGDAPHLVIVRTDPGYAGNPGHEGTGMVVATLR